jgi:hypothetical protein
MRRSVAGLACTLLLLAAAVVPALSKDDFNKVVDFSVTLKSLFTGAEGGTLPGGRFLILTGTVSDVNILDKNEATFKVRIEVITGEWIRTEDVKSYTCYVEFSGPEYFAVFPARAPREATSGVVLLNSRILVVGRPVSIVATPLGAKQALVEGIAIRTMQ